MTGQILYAIDRATPHEIAAHLLRCDARFVPPLSERVAIPAYAAKIGMHAARFEAWVDGALVGLAAAYLNGAVRCAFVTNVSVVAEHCRSGIATRLLEQLVEHARRLGFRRVSLEVSSGQRAAVRLYERCGFAADGEIGGARRMVLDLEKTGVGNNA